MIDVKSLPIKPENILTDAVLPGLPEPYRGKVRENYDLPDGKRLLIASDRISAFDRHLASIPFKGQVLTQISRFWFEQTKDICPNHALAYPDPNVMVCQRLKMLPVEMVMRGYLAGTTSTAILPMYKRGERKIYGITFPNGMRDNQKLPQIIITPTTKAGHGDHDAPLTPEEIVGKGLLTRKQWDEVSSLALALFARGQEIAQKHGLILVDTKYEFGLDEQGRITLGDEVHTPDSSRYWLADSYGQSFAKGERPQSLDKDYIRSWVGARCDPYKDPIPEIPREVILEAAEVYIKAFETITGQDFPLPDLNVPILERIRKNLAPYFLKKAS